MAKYVRLNKERTKLTSPFMATKPNPVKRFSDEELPTYDWFRVEEATPVNPDSDLYYLNRNGWEFVDGPKPHVLVNYVVTPASIDQQRQVIAKRCHAHRDELLLGGLTFRGKVIDTKPETHQRVMNYAIAAMSNPDIVIEWIADDNSTLILNAAGIAALAKAFVEFEGSMVMKCRDLKNQIELSDAPIDFDYMTGWPTTVFE